MTKLLAAPLITRPRNAVAPRRGPRPTRFTIVWLVLLPGLIPCLVSAQDSDDGLPNPIEIGKFIYEQNCMICHSDELIRAQRLTEKQWTAEVEKMISWGAPVDAAEIPSLLAYLNHAFPATQQPPRELLRESPRFAGLLQPPLAEPLPPNSDPERGQTAYRQLCGTCHGMFGEGGSPGGMLLLRPSLASRTDFLQLMRTGRGRMPAYLPTQLPDDAIDDILAHLRAAGKPAFPPPPR